MTIKELKSAKSKKFYSSHIYPWKATINYRLHPFLYRVGKGEQGVLICQPYKNELLPYWQFKTPLLAKISANKLYALFLNYLNENDFPGADMARKYLQMGFTRSRRYANYKGGRKYTAKGHKKLPKGTGEKVKSESANIFYKAWQQAENNEKYMSMKLAWEKSFG